MIKDALKIGGVFNFKIYENTRDFAMGIIKQEIDVHNTMTNASLAVISGLVGNTGAQTAFGYIAVGTDATAPAASQTALVAEIVDSGLSRAAATVSRTTTTQTNDTLVLAKTFTVTGTKTIAEVGIFNASSSGTMLCRATPTAASLISGNVFLVTYSVKFVGN